MNEIFDKLSIEKRIEMLHIIIDDLKGSKNLNFEIEQHFIQWPGTGRQEKIVPTGEISISISAYNPARDGRRAAMALGGD